MWHNHTTTKKCFISSCEWCSFVILDDRLCYIVLRPFSFLIYWSLWFSYVPSTRANKGSPIVVDIYVVLHARSTPIDSASETNFYLWRCAKLGSNAMKFLRPFTNAARVVNLPQRGAQNDPDNHAQGNTWTQPQCGSRSEAEPSFIWFHTSPPCRLLWKTLQAPRCVTYIVLQCCYNLFFLWMHLILLSHQKQKPYIEIGTVLI